LQSKAPWLHLAPNQQLLLTELPEQEQQTTAIATLKDTRPIYDEVAQIFNRVARERSSSYFGHIVKPGTRIVIQPALLRNRRGYSVDFYDRTTVDEVLCGRNKKYFRDMFLSEKALKEILENGTFSEFKDPKRNKQALINFMKLLGSDVTDLTPCRELTKAEQYELHQRWVWSEGEFMPSPNVKGPQEAERQMKNKPDPVGRTEFEETSFDINTYLLEGCAHFYFIYQLTANEEVEHIVD
jgi:hypothetical protein